MRIIRRGLVAVTVVGIVGLGWSSSVLAAGPTPAQQCESKKNQAAGAKATCLAKGHAAFAEFRTFNFAQCETNFSNAFAAAETKAGPGVCVTERDTAAIEAMVDTCMENIALALAGIPLPPGCPQFPATGQTTCWNSAGAVIACAGTGQDGDIQAGGTLSYTDNGDGTITDNNTRLMWAKKDDNDTDPLHDKDTKYTWADAFAVHIAGLNAGIGFAGYTDWRLPNVKELQSIINWAREGPAVSPAFSSMCAAGCTVITCSCTAPHSPSFSVFYWSSTTRDKFPGVAWDVNFEVGFVNATGKNNTNHVRAVRGGL